MKKEIKEINLKYELKDSKIHGKGLFAIDHIKSGEKIVDFEGELITCEEAMKKPEADSIFLLNVDDEWDLDCSVKYNEGKFINHSCCPNAELHTGDKKAWFIAVKDIKPGDEITFDYNLSYDEVEKCLCNSESCRGYMNDPDEIAETDSDK